MSSATFPVHDFRARLHADTGMRKAFIWALGMHLLLFFFLAFGLNWKSQTPAGLEAEIWDNVPVVKSAPVQAVEQKMEADDKADIAVKRKKELKPEPKKEEKPVKKVDPKELKKQKAEEEKQAKLKEAKLKEEKQKAQDKAKADAAKKEALAQDKSRADQLARLRSAAGKEGAAGGRGGVVGDGVGGGGNAKPGYADKVRRKILPLIVFNPSLVAGNPAVEVAVELAPDGSIINRNVLKSSGDLAWDRAVLRAIDDAKTLPKDDDGKVPKQMRLIFKPKD